MASDGGDGETNSGNPAMPVILKVTQSSTVTDINGLANLVPSRAGFSPPLIVDLQVAAGTAALLDFPLQVLPVPTIGGAAPATSYQPAFWPARLPLWRGLEER